MNDKPTNPVLRFLANAYSGSWGYVVRSARSKQSGQALGTLKDPNYAEAAAGGTPPTPPFNPSQWMMEAINTTLGMGQKTTNIDVRPAPYPTAADRFEPGKKYPPEEPPHEQSVVSASRVIQYLLARFDPIYGLTPRRLQEYLQQWQLGFLRWQGILWSYMRERDDQLKSVEAKRIFAVSRLKWEIVPVDDSPEASKHKIALESFYNNLTCTHVLEQNQQGGVSLLIRQMMSAIGYKFAVHEIVWNPDFDSEGKPVLSANFRFVPIWFFENRTGVLRYLPYELALDGIPLDAGGWLVTVGDGLLIASSIAYMYKQLGLKSWVNYVDKFGIPMIIGKTTAAYNSLEWTQFQNALAYFRSDGAALFNKDAIVESFKVEGGASEIPQEKLTDRMDRAIARLWRGGDLSTMSRGSNGAGALPQMQQEDELAEADAILCSEACNFYVDRYVTRYLFGATKPKAYFRIVPPLNVDTAKEIAVDQFLLSVGAKLALADAMARYGRRTPDEGDELLTPAAVPAQIGKGLGDGSPGGPLALGNVAEELFSNIRANSDMYRAAAMRELTKAQAQALVPLRDRFVAAAAIEDDGKRREACEEIKKELPTIFKSVSARSGELVTALNDILGTALLSGATQAAVARKQNT